MEEKDKKKILIGSVILVVTLILVVVGTTYAYFNMQVINNSKTTNMEITTGEQNKITLSSSLTNYHLHLKVSDMTLDKVGSSYYGTTDTGKDYEATEALGTKELGNISVSGELIDKYICSATININKSGNMSTILEEGDLILVIKEGNRENRYDLSKALTNPNFKFNINNSNIEPIKAYLKFTNQNKDQSNIAGKELTISININDFNCEVDESKPALEVLKAHAVGGEEAVTFTEVDVDGMYRYKGTKDEVTNNYICFGTDEKDRCLETPETYMYRIIGITDKEDNTINLPANSLKIIKAIPPKTHSWHRIADDTKWDSSDMKDYLNNTFLPDAVNNKWESGSYWEKMIFEHKWYNVDQPSIVTDIEPTTSHTDASKIGLMYATDYKNSGEENTNNWLFIANGWIGNSPNYEWTMTRYSSNRVWPVYLDGSLKTLNTRNMSDSNSIRPVFYVSPNVTLTGEGTKENPFIIYY